MIEELDDIIEEIANNLGVYGSHSEASPDCECRVCFTSDLTSRILSAVDVRDKLAARKAEPVEEREGL